MRYKVYMTHSIESLEDSLLIATRSNYKDCWEAINDFLKKEEISKERYVRYLLDNEKQTVFIDFGSWSTFAAISPIPQEIFD